MGVPCGDGGAIVIDDFNGPSEIVSGDDLLLSRGNGAPQRPRFPAPIGVVKRKRVSLDVTINDSGEEILMPLRQTRRRRRIVGSEERVIVDSVDMTDDPPPSE